MFRTGTGSKSDRGRREISQLTCRLGSCIAPVLQGVERKKAVGTGPDYSKAHPAEDKKTADEEAAGEGSTYLQKPRHDRTGRRRAGGGAPYISLAVPAHPVS